jgi:hypothetical protein
MSRPAATFVSSLIVATCVSSAARADALILSGAEHGVSSSYAFIGTIIPLPGNALGSGWGVRLWGDYLAYDYASGPNTIEASGWGGEVSGVYQFSGAWGWSNLSLGARYRDTALSPDDPGNRARGAHVHLTVQADGGYNIDAFWRLRGIANYTSSIDGYYLQPAIDRSVSGRVRLGIDATFQGDKSYKQFSAGANLTLTIDSIHSFGLRAGTSSNGSDTGVYGGVSFVFTRN